MMKPIIVIEINILFISSRVYVVTNLIEFLHIYGMEKLST